MKSSHLNVPKLQIIYWIKRRRKEKDKHRDVPRRIDNNINQWIYDKLYLLSIDQLSIEDLSSYRYHDLKPNNTGKKSHYFFKYEWSNFTIVVQIENYNKKSWVFFLYDGKEELIRSYYSNDGYSCILFTKFSNEDLYKLLKNIKQ